MDEHSESSALASSLRGLDWPKVIERLLELVYSEPAADDAAALDEPESWAETVDEAQRWQAEVKEVIPLLSREFIWTGLRDLGDVSEGLEALRKDRVIDPAVLYELRCWLAAMDAWSEIPVEETRGPLFSEAVASIPHLREPLAELNRVFAPSGEIKDTASPAYQGLIAEVRSIKASIRSRMEELVKEYSAQGVLQESFTDVRDGRHVLPVKISSQSKVKGRVFDSSVSQQTVYVEPREIEELDHRLGQAESKRRAELYRILQSLCKMLAPHVDEIEHGIDIMAYWDLVQARARLGQSFGGKPIRVTDSHEVSLSDTAHPLLWGTIPTESIIRNDVEVRDPTRAILFTGPNTGGKTVLLKTLGLAAIFARTGIPFPGRTEATVPFFDRIFVDLGDPQSIEEHLSSFAGHLKRFKEILETPSGRTLILLDELNSATDPEEGAALSRAVLEALIERENPPLIVVTTHDPQLKALALQHEQMMNASLEFNEDTLHPTYRVVFGVPGRSRALETAQRLGLPAELLERAKSYVSRQHQEFEDLISKLETDAHQAEKARKRAQALEREANENASKWRQRATQGVQEELEKSRKQLSDLYKETNNKIKALLGTVTKVRSQDVSKTQERLGQIVEQALEGASGALTEQMPEAAEAVKAVEEERRRLLPKLEPGAEVRVPKWKKKGEILEVNGDQLKVRLGGMMTITISVTEVEPTGEVVKKVRPKASTSVSIENEMVSHELDLRGRRFEDAMGEIQVYLNRAFASGMKEVVIIHGLGTGALREGTHGLLKELPFVKSYNDGGRGRGGSGATVVLFDL